MRGSRFVVFAALAAVLVSSPAIAAVEVEFHEPDRYTDAYLDRASGKGARQATLIGLRAHLERLGEQHLRRGQTLAIEVLDVDLAGRFEPLRGRAFDTRILREVTWPRIVLRYKLRDGGRVVREGEETVVDLRYLQRGSTQVLSDPLKFEKAMLDDWFPMRFAAERAKR